MKLLITGGAGFIGSNLVRFLLEETDCEVVNVDKLTYAGNLDSLADVSSNPRYRFVHADIADTGKMRELFLETKPDGVMHLAAESHVDRSIDGPGDFIETNIVGTFSLLQAARSLFSDGDAEFRARFRFLHVSTDEVYGSLGPKDPAFTERTPYDPHSPYSASKAASDHLARAWGDTFGLPIIVTNCSNNYGPYQFPEKLIPVVILKALKGDVIPVYGKGENVRDWIYVRDHARGLYAALTRGRFGETYNLGGQNEQRNIDLVRMLCGLLDELRPREGGAKYQELIEFVKDRPGHDLRYAIDAEKAREELGWEPEEDFSSGFRKTVKWYLEERSWWEGILNGEYKLDRIGLG